MHLLSTRRSSQFDNYDVNSIKLAPKQETQHIFKPNIPQVKDCGLSSECSESDQDGGAGSDQEEKGTEEDNSSLSQDYY